jgi:hypothetical protein
MVIRLIEAIAKKHNLSVTQVEDTCKNLDRKYWKWILKRWHEGSIILPEDGLHVTEVLGHFRAVLPQLSVEQRDISRYQHLADIEAVVEPILGIQSLAVSHCGAEDMPGVEVVSRHGPYTILRVSDAGSLALLGEGTKWCTRASYADSQSKAYIKRYGCIYIVFEYGVPVVQYTPDFGQVMDTSNRFVGPDSLPWKILMAIG